MHNYSVKWIIAECIKRDFCSLLETTAAWHESKTAPRQRNKNTHNFRNQKTLKKSLREKEKVFFFSSSRSDWSSVLRRSTWRWNFMLSSCDIIFIMFHPFHSSRRRKKENKQFAECVWDRNSSEIELKTTSEVFDKNLNLWWDLHKKRIECRALVQELVLVQ